MMSLHLFIIAGKCIKKHVIKAKCNKKKKIHPSIPKIPDPALHENHLARGRENEVAFYRDIGLLYAIYHTLIFANIKRFSNKKMLGKWQKGKLEGGEEEEGEVLFLKKSARKQIYNC